jgi:hypothetical protein
MPSELTSSIGRFGLIAAGGYAFGPIGAAAGGLLGSFLFGSSGPEIEGPRLGDTSVSASTYGNVIPVGFGVQKMAGSMIWTTDIEEEKNTRTEGGGVFGGGQKITEYRYYANFAVAFGEGPCTGLLRLWAGEKLIADVEAPDLSAGGFASLAGAMKYFRHNERYRFRFYRGTSEQDPDPLIEANVDHEVGANATPGFRDLVYLVFERLPLDEFGNRIPPITAEIAWTSLQKRPLRPFTFMPTPPNQFGSTFSGQNMAVDWHRHYAYIRSTGGGPLGNGGIRRLNLLTALSTHSPPTRVCRIQARFRITRAAAP